jgi:GT2 family glycosyltransferase
LVQAARECPGTAALGSLQLMSENRATIDGAGDCYHISGLFWRAAHGRSLAATKLEAREIFSPCAAAALYRKAAVDEIGGFDEAFFCYGEDVDLGFRLRLAGWKSMLVPDAVVRHVGSASSGGQRSQFASYHGHRNMVWVYMKNMPGLLFWLFLPLHILANIASVAVLTLRGQGKVAWRAKRDAIKGLPKMWKKRKAIQAKRVSSLWDILRALSWR